MSRARIYDRLENWGRYWRDTDGQFTRCRSLESRFVFHRHLDSRIEADAEQERIAKRPPEPEMRDAELVNAAWKRCSKDTKKMLQFSFCFGRVDDRFVCERCGIRKEALPLRFARAIAEIARELDEPKIRPTMPRNNSRTRPDKAHPADSAETEAQSAPTSTVAASSLETEETEDQT